MNGSTSASPTTHSAAYYEYQQTSHSSSPARNGPAPLLQRPPAVYTTHARSSPAGRYQPENLHAKTSVSSATSASSAASDLKPHQPIRSYQMGSQAEKGQIRDSSRRTSHFRPYPSHGPQRSNIGHSEMVEDNSAVIRYLHEHEIEENLPRANDHAIWILFWLSFLDPFHSLFSCFYTILVVLGLAVLSPFRLFQKEKSFGTSIVRTLAPIYRNHLQMIYAPSVKNAHTFNFSPTALVLIHILSPFLSFGVAFFSWIAAVFWLFAIIMGNPDGTEKGDDGRATVIGVRNWWEKYFLSALRR